MILTTCGRHLRKGKLIDHFDAIKSVIKRSWVEILVVEML